MTLGEPDDGALACRRCRCRYERVDGIWRLLTAARRAQLASFVAAYRARRERPQAAVDDQEREDMMRRFDCLVADHRAARVLDVGAGSGWLSHRLGLRGHRVVAVDWLDDEPDGLPRSPGRPASFVPVQADFDALPFSPFQFDLVVFSDSLQYAPDVAATLGCARRMLAPNGRIAVMHSPLLRHEADGFLTTPALARACARLGLEAEFTPTPAPFWSRVRRHLEHAIRRRPRATFGLWVAE